MKEAAHLHLRGESEVIWGHARQVQCILTRRVAGFMYGCPENVSAFEQAPSMKGLGKEADSGDRGDCEDKMVQREAEMRCCSEVSRWGAVD